MTDIQFKEIVKLLKQINSNIIEMNSKLDDIESNTSTVSTIGAIDNVCEAVNELTKKLTQSDRGRF